MTLSSPTFKFLILLVITMTFSNCSSSKIKFQEDAPLEHNRPYFQEWVAGIKDGGSGVNIYFPNLVTKNNTKVDSVFFRKMKGKLRNGKASYFATLKKPIPQDITMSGDSKSEYGNKLPEFPFELKNNECVISYIEGGETKYVKIANLKEKAGEYYPSSPPNN